MSNQQPDTNLVQAKKDFENEGFLFWRDVEYEQKTNNYTAYSPPARSIQERNDKYGYNAFKRLDGGSIAQYRFREHSESIKPPKSSGGFYLYTPNGQTLFSASLVTARDSIRGTDRGKNLAKWKCPFYKQVLAIIREIESLSTPVDQLIASDPTFAYLQDYIPKTIERTNTKKLDQSTCPSVKRFEKSALTRHLNCMGRYRQFLDYLKRLDNGQAKVKHPSSLFSTLLQVAIRFGFSDEVRWLARTRKKEQANLGNDIWLPPFGDCRGVLADCYKPALLDCFPDSDTLAGLRAYVEEVGVEPIIKDPICNHLSQFFFYLITQQYNKLDEHIHKNKGNGVRSEPYIVLSAAYGKKKPYAFVRTLLPDPLCSIDGEREQELVNRMDKRIEKNKKELSSWVASKRI